MTSSVERTDLDFKISVALMITLGKKKKKEQTTIVQVGSHYCNAVLSITKR